MLTNKVVPWRNLLECESSKWEVEGASPNVGKDVSLRNSCFLYVPHSLTLRLRIKSSVTCTNQYPVLALFNRGFKTYVQVLFFCIHLDGFSSRKKSKSACNPGQHAPSILVHACADIL